ncbi:MAG: hypothetical protein PHU64_04445 [Candidatus Omnitrophica bacterium]|nr:hypothetical protein [Candidatus Omnitrophota bacterium]MDD5429440.1 hypothetical protein [Candidatus Omnitrophota bacterium]
MKIFKVIVVIWLIIWGWFFLRQFRIDEHLFPTYKKLFSSGNEERRRLVFGENFYDFMKFSKHSIPSGSAYEIVGLEADSVDLVRLVYFMYPCLRSSEPEYILVYEQPGFDDKELGFHSLFDGKSFILKRKN